ncbi:acyl-CoA dehydrogenase family protein [Saccharothrix coeruleofusca]|uniref:Acyl-CoA dehydrogenase n=1 Tax=Saccharothrix coeruleofusca TaxID=33919 RepID=A0A918ARM6_9PSEU|nr:acyl-CoA dehydrogenase family protein [Saccharothrix coeruleofusca]MBP2336000.1 alkylation response protein AidB-like acyl-CoA dehydrogenase [Saccharothrix coeruleofusca]GGP76086.1 acyl-CoA dehydrogenase [Saccharothrix coeruleofusca]
MSASVVDVLKWLRHGDFPDRADHWEQAGAVDAQGVREAADAGLLGLTVPRRYGGDGWSLPEVVEVHRTMAGFSPSLQSLLVVHSMVCQAVLRWGRSDLRELVLPELAAGTKIAAFALTEAESGSDIRSLRTTLAERDGEILVTGRKRWISFGELADVFLVFGMSDGGGSCALVPAGAGQRVSPEPPTTGLRASRLADIEFDATPTSANLAVGRPGFGVPHVATSCLTLGRVLVAAAAVGVAQAAVELATAHAAQRQVGGVALGDRQLVRGLLAEASILAEAAWAMVRAAAERVEERDPEAATAAGRAKVLAARAVSVATDHASRVLGAAGLAEGHRLTRLSQAARTYQVIEGPNEVLLDLVGADLLRREAATRQGGDR